MTKHWTDDLDRIAELVPEPEPLSDEEQLDLVFVDEVRAMLKGKFSDWWVRHNVAPDAKQKFGRHVAWPRKAVVRWIAARGNATLPSSHRTSGASRPVPQEV